jgi:D-alanine-D-alanine ligase-like ATP-grasp enzyme/ribosomal protein S18 acetylase RimI-like enzyme
MCSLPAGVLILHNTPRVPDETHGRMWKESDAGVLFEVRAVEEALRELAVPCRVAGVRYLSDIPGTLSAGGEGVVFNLVEELDGVAGDANLAPAVCRALDRSPTGSDTTCLTLCLDKWQTRAALQAAGIAVPPGVVVPPGSDGSDLEWPCGPLLVKPLRSDASEGIDGRSVTLDAHTAMAVVRRLHADLDQPALVEQFIAGREINVSLLETDGGVCVLPLAEIDFSAFPPDKPRIVDYAAKWLADSFEFQNTPRRIPAPLDEPAADAIRRLALAAWRVVGCRDYARVDLRLDENGCPFVLEVNANPDISPDAGFAAALAAAGISYAQFVQAAIRNALGRRTMCVASAPLVPAARAPVTGEIRIRWSQPSDHDAILNLMAETGFFRSDEMEVAREVLEDALLRGAKGHYQSYTAAIDDRPVGWACFGPTPCTMSTFDLYWIAVAPACQGRHIGAVLLQHAERLIAEADGRILVVDTSGRPQYHPTRRFYERQGYSIAAVLPEFYAPGDDKVVFAKRLSG